MTSANVKTKNIYELHGKIHNVLSASRFNLDTIENINRSNLTKVAFVRHPFHRLVSCFSNKILSDNDKSFTRLRKQVKKDFKY